MNRLIRSREWRVAPRGLRVGLQGLVCLHCTSTHFFRSPNPIRDMFPHSSESALGILLLIHASFFFSSIVFIVKFYSNDCL